MIYGRSKTKAIYYAQKFPSQISQEFYPFFSILSSIMFILFLLHHPVVEPKVAEITWNWGAKWLKRNNFMLQKPNSFGEFKS